MDREILTITDFSFTPDGATDPVLDAVNLRVNAGQTLAIMGRSGAGKSTLCLTMNGLVPRTVQGQHRGKVTIGDQDLASLTVREIAGRVGIVLQDFEAQLFSTSVTREIAFGPENLALPRSEIIERVERHLKLLDLADLRKREPGTLSGGQKQRLALAAVLSLEPELLILDEPTSDMDPVTRLRILGLAKSASPRTRTIVTVEQDPDSLIDAEGTIQVDSVALMDGGRVTVEGPAREILTDLTALDALGIRAPQTARVFQRLGMAQRPLNVVEAADILRPLLRAGAAPPPPDVPGSRRTGPPALRAEMVGHHYDDAATPALAEVSCAIHQGEFVAIVGKNGSGKSTLAKILSGLLKPTTGAVHINGSASHQLAGRRLAQGVAYVYQNPDHQLFSATASEEVSFGPANFGLAPAVVAERSAAALDNVGLTHVAARDPFSLGKGERQRLAIASVLAMEPEALVLDEPTTGLDMRQETSVLALLERLNGAGRTIVVATHNLNVVARYATRVLVMRDGRLVADGHPHDVFHQEEDLLRSCGMILPPVVRLARTLGLRSLTVRELVRHIRDVGT